MCYLTLCDVQYPTKLAFHYLQDLRKEFEKVELKIVEAFSKPYAFKKFGNIKDFLLKKKLKLKLKLNLI